MALFSSNNMKKVDDEDKSRNWAELPPELTTSILLRLDAIDILENAQKVCKPWRRVTKDPSMWRKINMQNTGNLGFSVYKLLKMCCNAVDRSEGGLVEIKIRNFGYDQLPNYIAVSSSNLRCFSLAMHYGMSKKGFVKAVAKLPLLEELEVSEMRSKLDLKAIGHSCSRLNTLKLNCSGYWRSYIEFDDNDALAIAESMPELRHLQLLCNGLSDNGLNAILDNCSHLEHLDLRKCFNVNLVGKLEKRCSERIKELRRPNDSTADYPFDTTCLNIRFGNLRLETTNLSEQCWSFQEASRLPGVHTIVDTDSDSDGYFDYMDHDDSDIKDL